MPTILVFDTETTGLPDFKLAADHPSQPRIVEVAALLMTGPDDPGVELDVLIRPHGWTVPAEATAIHGITTADCEARGVPIVEALQQFNTMMDRADLVAGFGVDFDLKMLRGALRREGMPDRYGEVAKFCVMRACTPICKIPPTDRMMATGRKGFKQPKLVEAIEIIFGEKLDGAHRAMNDVRATARLYWRLAGMTGGPVPVGSLTKKIIEEAALNVDAPAQAADAPAPAETPAVGDDLSII